MTTKTRGWRLLRSLDVAVSRVSAVAVLLRGGRWCGAGGVSRVSPSPRPCAAAASTDPFSVSSCPCGPSQRLLLCPIQLRITPSRVTQPPPHVVRFNCDPSLCRVGHAGPAPSASRPAWTPVPVRVLTRGWPARAAGDESAAWSLILFGARTDRYPGGPRRPTRSPSIPARRHSALSPPSTTWERRAGSPHPAPLFKVHPGPAARPGARGGAAAAGAGAGAARWLGGARPAASVGPQLSGRAVGGRVGPPDAIRTDCRGRPRC